VLQSVKPRAGERSKEKRTPEKVRTAPARIAIFKEGDNPWYEVTIIEGRNRQIRRMFEEIGHHVEKIKRVKYGPLQLDVESGKYRSLSDAEVARLKSAIRPRRAAS
jgi:23S rRNA pseudouridine2605 synthase